jgi:hypothetical protein
VRTTLNGVSKQWVFFVEGIVARENLLGCERLWDDFVQEETRRGYQQVMRRRMRLLLQLERISSKRVQREDTSPRVKGINT